MTNYGPHFEIHVNGIHIFTVNKLATMSGETYVTYHNNLTGAKDTRVYKTERAANIQIRKAENRVIRVYRDYIGETTPAAESNGDLLF